MHVTASETKRSVSAICTRFKISRAAFYKATKTRSRKEINEALILALVRQEREVNPCAGTKKVLVAIRPKLKKAGIDIGRNRLGELLKREDLLVGHRKVFHCRTTKQDPSLVPSSNLVKDMKLTAPNQALCSDITYIYTEEGFIYLSLMMDMFAKDIVGWAISDTLETESGPLAALKMAMKTVGPGKEVVAHSDRGCQYGSRAYRSLLDTLGWKSSMTEELHCYENGMAERLNGILKGEYFLDRHFKTKAEAEKAIKETIWIYNNRRLHEKLNYKTPVEFRTEWFKEAA
jgi:transposase InsO family protein